MLAECYIYENQIDKALTAINKIRQRWALELIGPGNGDVAHTYNEVIYDKASLLTRLQDVEKPLDVITSYSIHYTKLYDKNKPFRQYIFTTHSGDGNMNIYPIRSVRSEKYKYILNLHPEFYHSSIDS